MNWSNPDTRLLLGDHKDRQRSDLEERTAGYKGFRRSLPRQYYVTDVDHIEYRIENDVIRPVALLELTRYDETDPHDNYFKAILDRYNHRDKQGDMARFCAEKLGCKAWIVLFRRDLTCFWVYNLTDDRGWWTLDQEAYKRWLMIL